MDQSARLAWEKDFENEGLRDRVRKVDADNTVFLKKLIAEYGWPKISIVGKDVALEAWYIAQHTPDKDFLKECLKLMQQNPNEVEAFNLARTIDRIRLGDGLPQYYGTHFIQSSDGKWVPQPIEDEDNVDERRAKIGQPSMEEKLKEYNG